MLGKEARGNTQQVGHDFLTSNPAWQQGSSPSFSLLSWDGVTLPWDLNYGKYPWRAPLGPLSAGTPLSEGIFVANPRSQHTLPAWVVL